MIYFPPLQRVFQTESLLFSDILKILLVTSSIIILDTLRKLFTPAEDPMRFVQKFVPSARRRHSLVSSAGNLQEGDTVGLLEGVLGFTGRSGVDKVDRMA